MLFFFSSKNSQYLLNTFHILNSCLQQSICIWKFHIFVSSKAYYVLTKYTFLFKLFCAPGSPSQSAVTAMFSARTNTWEKGYTMGAEHLPETYKAKDLAMLSSAVRP